MSNWSYCFLFTFFSWLSNLLSSIHLLLCVHHLFSLLQPYFILVCSLIFVRLYIYLRTFIEGQHSIQHLKLKYPVQQVYIFGNLFQGKWFNDPSAFCALPWRHFLKKLDWLRSANIGFITVITDIGSKCLLNFPLQW